MHGRALLGFGVFFQRDVAAYWLPHVEAFVATVAQGRAPWWNPWVVFGHPMFANPAMQLAYPPTWLNLLLPPASYYALFVAAHALFGGWGAARLGRAQGLSEVASACVGLAFVASGPWVSAASLWHHYAGAAWMPWVLAGLEDVLDGPCARTAARLGLRVGLQALAGSADLCLMTAIVAALRAAPRMRGPAALARLRAGAGAVGIGALVASIQWLPTLLDLGQGSRLSMPASTRLYWSLHPAALLDLLVPGLLGAGPLAPGARNLLFEGREPLLAWTYVGASTLVPVVLAVVGRRRAGGAAALALALFVGLALGRHFPPAAWLGGLPPLGLIRFPVKFLLPAALCWALLVGIGMQCWVEEWGSESRRRGRRIGLAAGLLALVGVGSAVLVGLAPTAPFGWYEPTGPAAPPGLVHATAALSLVAVVTFLRSRRGPVGPWALVMLAVMSADLLPVAMRINPLAPPELFDHRPPVVDRLLPAADVSRVYFVSPGPDRIERSIARGPVGWSAEQRLALGTLELLRPPQGVRWRLRGSYDGDFTGMASPLLGPLGALVYEHRPDILGLRLLQIGNVGHVVSLDEHPFSGSLREVARIDSIFHPPVRVHAVPGVVPPAFLVGTVRETPDAVAPAAFVAEGFEPRRVALVPPGSRLEGTVGLGGDGGVRVLERSPGLWRLEVAAQGGALLVVVDSFRAGWKGRVDGDPARLVRANLLFMGVPVPPGTHTVELRYRPPGLAWGAALALGGWVVGGVLARRPAVAAGEAAL